MKSFENFKKSSANESSSYEHNIFYINVIRIFFETEESPQFYLVCPVKGDRKSINSSLVALGYKIQLKMSHSQKMNFCTFF